MHGRFAKLALACVQREFPYNPGHALKAAGDLRRPRQLHPAFYGCYDWHSAVHGHWLLAHLARKFPALKEARSIRKVLVNNLSRKNLQIEAAYLRAHPGFERPYGWAWALKLAQELGGWDDRLRANLQPLVEVIEAKYLDWLPKQTYPIRSGTHANTAFGLGFALDYAVIAERPCLEKMIRRKAIEYYGSDRDYPAQWEPGGNDFLSPCLVEADLMRRVLAPGPFSRWFRRFLPKIPKSLSTPAKVSDRSDGQLAHLDGLNLSRAWCFFRLGKKELGKKHLAAGLKHVASGSYAGEHWLASFAAYALSAARESEAAGSARAARG